MCCRSEDKQLLTWSQSGTITSWHQGSVTSSIRVNTQTRFPIYSCGYFDKNKNRLLSACGGKSAIFLPTDEMSVASSIGDGSKPAVAFVPGKY